MNLRLFRDYFADDYTLGKLFLDDEFLGYTCEDSDRRLEEGGEKIHGKTAIPRGRYKVVTSLSNRFKRVMPEVLSVPGFSGVRIHAGNTSADTEGCPLLGEIRTANGVRNCAAINRQLVALLDNAEKRKEECWITVE